VQNSTSGNMADLDFDATIVADACVRFGMVDWKKGGETLMKS